ncbi:unnamed protein product [Closterium sp. NIES-65]|nr:unnamed protein product [Closterium sp. NIES-65]CAI6004552.1 unnamed protein product [Closterium sp. NIES-65]
MGEAWERKEDEEKLPGVWHQGAMGAVQGCWIRVSGEACERLGRGMGEAWEQHGSRMGAAWESHGSSMGVAWERHGSSMGVAWEHSMGVAWEWHGSSMGVAWEQHGSGMGKAFKRHEVLVALLPRVHPRSRNDLQGGWHSWWRFYPCAPSEPKRPAGWVAQLVQFSPALVSPELPPVRCLSLLLSFHLRYHLSYHLVRKGIQEINIVGDSHQRVLSFHLRYLLSGAVQFSPALVSPELPPVRCLSLLLSFHLRYHLSYHLVRKGIQEINIVGDSHQRVLSFHLRYLLSGAVQFSPALVSPELPPVRCLSLLLSFHLRYHLSGVFSPLLSGFADERMVRSHEDMNFTLVGFADERMVRSHEDMNFTVTDERSSKVLRINFYWVDGIYRNREYGCSLRGQYTHNYHTFPNISTTANVTVIEGGYWAGKLRGQYTHNYHTFPNIFTTANVTVTEGGYWAGKLRGQYTHNYHTFPNISTTANVTVTEGGYWAGKLRGQYTHNYHTFPNISTTANVTVIEGGYWAGKLRGQYTHNYHTFPNISTTANVTVIEGGYWAGKWCAEPLQALRARLPEFFIWALLAARSNRARVVFRTPPPVPNAGSHCLDYAIKRGFAGPATNLYLAAANRHARQLAASETRGAEMAVFDSWAVEAPRYGDTCPGDHHYSCFLGGQKRTKPVVRGAVGDAVARTFLHFLLHSLRMEDSSTAEEQNNT